MAPRSTVGLFVRLATKALDPLHVQSFKRDDAFQR